MSTYSFIEDHYSEELISRSAVIYKTSSIHLTRNEQDKSISAEVSDGKTYLITIENPLTSNQISQCQCSQYLEDGNVCRHILATLLNYRDIVFENQDTPAVVKPISEKITKRLSISDILQNVSKDELNSFIISYAKEDKRLSTAIKVHFARVLESDQKADKYKSILNSISPPITQKSKKINLTDIRSLCRVLDDFYGQMQDCLALGEYLEASFILEASLFKISYVLHFANQQHEILLDLSKKFHVSIYDFFREKISPRLKQDLKNMLFELTETSYYEIFHSKANAFYYLNQLAKTSEKPIYINHAVKAYNKAHSGIFKEHIISTIWPTLSSKQQMQWVECVKSDKLSLVTINNHLLAADKADKAIELSTLFLDKMNFDKDIANQLIEVLANKNQINSLINHVLNCVKKTNDYLWINKAKKLIDPKDFSLLYTKIDEWINSKANQNKDMIIAHLRCSDSVEKIMDEIAKQYFSIEAINAYEDILYVSDATTVTKLYIYHIDDYLENHIGLATAEYLKELRLHINKAGMRDIVLPIVRHLSIQYGDKPYLTESFGLLSSN